MKTFYLREIAHARAGDKGDASNIGVIAYHPDYYPLLLEQVTVERVRQHFGELVRGAITRYEMPHVEALNFVLENSLGGGVTRSLSLDPHGKSYGALILTLPVTVSDVIAARLERQGRVPLGAQVDARAPSHAPSHAHAHAAAGTETFAGTGTGTSTGTSTSTSTSTSQRIALSVAEARALSLAALHGIGYNEADAAILADHMLDAALCGYEYSGLPKILQVAANPKLQQPVAPMKVLHQTPVSTLLDGGNQSGMLTLHHATDVAIAKARAHGFALIGVTNSWMSGRSAYYVERIARAGLIGLHTAGTASLVAPPGGTRAVVGTNPIAFGFPTENEPLVIDVSTAAFPGTELGFYALLGLTLPEGVALDGAGAPTTDPGAAKLGALLPFGGAAAMHKGFALALAMQALGVLAGSGFNAAKDYGYLLVVMRPDLLLPLDQFKRELSATLARIKAVPRQAGVDEIRIPSERAFRERERAMREGLAIDRVVHDALTALAARRPAPVSAV